jgi:hypothetical protein
MFYAGADLGKSFSYVTVVDEMGKVVLSGLRPQLKLAIEATRVC